MAIELPDLVQRVRVDASDMARAERGMRSAGAAYDRTAASADHLADSQAEAAESSRELGDETRDAGRATSRTSSAYRRLADNVRAVRSATDTTRRSVAASTQSAENLREAELRLQLAQRRVTQSQAVLNRLRDEGKEGTDEYVRAEIRLIDAMRRVAREQNQAARAARIAAVDLGAANAGLVRFSRQARKAGDASRFLAFAISQLKIPAIVTAAAAAGAALSALGAGAVALTAQLVGGAASLSGALAAIPAGLTAIVSTTGVFKAVTSGAGEAAEAIRKYGRDSEQAQEALAGLSPQARRFALDLEDLVGRFETIKRAGQAAALPGFSAALRQARALLPIVQDGFVGVATSLSRVAREAATAFTAPAFRRDLGVIAARNAELVRILARAALNLVVALKGVMLAAGPMTETLARATKNLIGNARAFTESAEGQARMARFFARTTENVFRFVRSLRDLTVGLVNFGRIASQALGIDFTGGLERAIARFREFTESTSGQSRIAAYFEAARPALVETGRLIRDIAKALVGLGANRDIAPVIAKIRTELLPAIIDLTRAVSSRLAPIIVDLATAFVKFQNVLAFSPIIEVAGALAKLTIALTDLIARVPGLSTVVASLIAMRVAITGLAVAGKITGIAALAGTIGAVGSAGTVGAKGVAGFVQGLRGLNTQAGGTVTLANRIGAAFRGVRTDTANAVTPTSRFAGALGTAARVLGPWTPLLAGAAVGLGVWAQKNREAKQRVDELTESLRASNGVIEENTRRTTFNSLVRSGAVKAAKELGINLRDLVDASLGEAAAQERVNAALEAAGPQMRVFATGGRGATASFGELQPAIDKVSDAIGNQNTALQKARAALKDEAAAGLEAAEAIGAVTAASGGLTAASQGVISVSDETRRAFIRTEVQAGRTRAAAKGLADQLFGIKQASPVNVTVAVNGIDPAIQRLADLQWAISQIPRSVTVGIQNKIGGAGGALGESVEDVRRTSPRVAEREAAQQAQSQQDAVTKAAEEVGYTAGSAGGEAAREAFVNEFVKDEGELTKAGRRLVDNLVKALSGSSSRISETVSNLRTLIKGAFSGGAESRLLDQLRTTNRRLRRLVDEREDLTSRIKQARDDVLSDARSAGEGLQAAITGSGNVTQAGTDSSVEQINGPNAGTTTSTSTNILRIIGNLRAKVAAARKFASDLRELKKRGINADTLRQLIEAGPEAGGDAARALAAATDEQLKEVNALQGQLTTTGQRTGKFAEETMVQTGMDAIAGLLKGLRARRGEVEKEMRSLARAMRRAMREELGIASPSKVMADDVSDPAVDGIVGRLLKRRPDVASAAAELGRSIIPAVPRAGDVGALPQRPVTAANAPTYGNYFDIRHLDMPITNPAPEPASESAVDRLAYLQAELQRT